MSVIIAVTLIFLQDFILLPRLQSINKLWMAPVATKTIGSTSQDHLNRGSVLAIDWTAYYGSYVYPPADAKVIYSGSNNAGGYGCWYLLLDKYGYRHILEHLNPATLQFKSGAIVKQSDVLGTVARTGITSWYHTHWEISKDSKRIPLENLFDLSGMGYTKIRDVNKVPTKWDRTINLTSNTNINYLGILWLGLFLIWIKYANKSKYTIALGLVFFVATTPFLPTFFNQTSGDDLSRNDKFAFTYKFVQRWEGTSNKCVYDPVRTMNGVTQQAYDSYRKSKGWSKADVCTYLTERQAEELYYRRYYLASGADKLPVEFALQVFDMSVNAGVGVGAAMQKSCGSNHDNLTYQCYVNYRANFYRNARNCSLYCDAWFNRLNDTTKFLLGRKG